MDSIDAKVKTKELRMMFKLSMARLASIRFVIWPPIC